MRIKNNDSNPDQVVMSDKMSHTRVPEPIYFTFVVSKMLTLVSFKMFKKSWIWRVF